MPRFFHGTFDTTIHSVMSKDLRSVGRRAPENNEPVPQNWTIGYGGFLHSWPRSKEKRSTEAKWRSFPTKFKAKVASALMRSLADEYLARYSECCIGSALITPLAVTHPPSNFGGEKETLTGSERRLNRATVLPICK